MKWYSWLSLKHLDSFFKTENISVLLNNKSFSMTEFEAEIPEDWILGPPSFLIYIKNLYYNLATKSNTHANNISHFLYFIALMTQEVI